VPAIHSGGLRDRSSSAMVQVAAIFSPSGEATIARPAGGADKLVHST
jgi:hypothetical protein